MWNNIQIFIKRYLPINRLIELAFMGIATLATVLMAFTSWESIKVGKEVAEMTQASILISENIANQNLTRLQTELRPYLIAQLSPEVINSGTSEYLKKDGNSRFYWESLHDNQYLILPFRIKNVGGIPAINIRIEYDGPSQSEVPLPIGQNSISPDDETSILRPWINISTIASNSNEQKFEIALRIIYKGNESIDPRAYYSSLKLTIMKKENGTYYVENDDFKFIHEDKIQGHQLLQTLKNEKPINYAGGKFNFMKIAYVDLLTIYGLYAVFVIFCFQEINNKIRNAQNNFRAWCSSRKNQVVTVNGQKVNKSVLDILGINREAEAWLEKDLIFRTLPH